MITILYSEIGGLLAYRGLCNKMRHAKRGIRPQHWLIASVLNEDSAGNIDSVQNVDFVRTLVNWLSAKRGLRRQH